LRKITVLVVDDSAVFRHAIRQAFKDHALIRIAAMAQDAYEARDFIVELEPDVMLLDVEMPRMNGITFLKKLMPQYPMPVVVMSAVADHVFEALECGAVDFIAKPGSRAGVDIGTFMRDVQAKIRIAARAKLARSASEAPAVPSGKEARRNAPSPYECLAIGASTGGTEAVLSVLQSLPPDTPGIVVVQHMPPGFTKSYAERLNRTTPFTVKEAESGDAVVPGTVLLAPGDKHLQIVRRAARLVADCFEGQRVSGHAPSVDVLFDSVARAAGTNAVGVILTGMGSDGALGLLQMRRSGARTLGQDEASCVVYGMPKVAFDVGAVERQASLQQIPAVIKKWLWS